MGWAIVGLLLLNLGVTVGVSFWLQGDTADRIRSVGHQARETRDAADDLAREVKRLAAAVERMRSW